MLMMDCHQDCHSYAMEWTINRRFYDVDDDEGILMLIGGMNSQLMSEGS